MTAPPPARARLAGVPLIVAVKQTVTDVDDTIGMIRAVGANMIER